MWLFFLLSGILRLGAWRTAHIAFHFFVFLFWEIPPRLYSPGCMFRKNNAAAAAAAAAICHHIHIVVVLEGKSYIIHVGSLRGIITLPLS